MNKKILYKMCIYVFIYIQVAEIGRLADMQLDEYPEYCSESQPEVDHMYENEQEPFEKETDDSE